MGGTAARLPRALLAVWAALVLTAAAACGPWPGTAARPGADLRIMVPNIPGGGYDTTARTAAKVMKDTGIAPDVQVFNLPGAGGVVGLQRIVDERGNGRLAMQMGLGVLGASSVSGARATVAHTTPIARLVEEPGAVVVPRNSPYRTIGELVAAWQKDPARVTVGGGSSPGGPDHLMSMQLAQAVGIDPRRVRYKSYDGGGGELLPVLLDGRLTFGASGFGELLGQIRAGQLRVLAVTSDRPAPALADVPTLRSQGIDLVFTNWRGIVAPPGISADDRRTWVEALSALRRTRAWKAELAKHGWIDAFATGEEYAAFLDAQSRAVARFLAGLGAA
ncbi:C4-dicarboxylate ABC transporter substrate-binding protein [Actinomadura sp. NBRC 104425]|uniref:tripartite tricarboxylate transporter substrate binding protein n=1 Tax=Actinomadura sp. NBRC 104425 TaxID=3032204 RepID=UPI0024A3A04F|nr:tripartite tricarboxylate transporter substrate binding protein [Actinomadura sp. NBRC 104425]GLZ12059.1 C4-dicarboxylate ABC transporter substrate-binding protein [Actinomadura sp. NBRC 104425]